MSLQEFLNMTFEELQAENERKLFEFLEFFELSLCKRCWAANYNQNCRPYHHHGGVFEFIDNLNLEEECVKRWIADEEHGFLHGFMVLYFAFCLDDHKDDLWDSLFQYNERKLNLPRIKLGEKFIMTCLFHDLQKVNGYDDHDAKLRNLSPNFEEVAYTHSDPSSSSHSLIGADRLELLRFKDSDEWCDKKVLKPHVEKYGGQDLVNHFFSHIRPVLAKMFMNRDDVWFSHIPEIEKHETLDDNYPKYHWVAKDYAYKNFQVAEVENYFSVNVGTLRQNICLFQHSHFNLGFPIGIINKSCIKRNGNQIKAAPISTCGRDHPFVVETNKMSLENWIFLHTETCQMNKFNNKNNLHILDKKLFEKIFILSEDLIIKLMAFGVK